MSKYPTIPDFNESPASMATALRAMKDSIEQLTGLRQGQSLGAPQVFVQEQAPSAVRGGTFSPGDFWIRPSTRTLSFWNGREWASVA